jgi:hypothetical protein
MAQNSKRVRTRKDILPGKRKVMSDLRLDLKVTALARSDTMRLSYDGIDVSEEDLFADDGQACSPLRICMALCIHGNMHALQGSCIAKCAKCGDQFVSQRGQRYLTISSPGGAMLMSRCAAAPRFALAQRTTHHSDFLLVACHFLP